MSFATIWIVHSNIGLCDGATNIWVNNMRRRNLIVLGVFKYWINGTAYDTFAWCVKET